MAPSGDSSGEADPGAIDVDQTLNRWDYLRKQIYLGERQSQLDSAHWSDIPMDIPRGAVQGVGNAVIGLIDLGDKISSSLFGTQEHNLTPFDDTVTRTGGFVSGVSQFLAGFLPAEAGVGAGAEIAQGAKLLKMVRGGEQLLDAGETADKIVQASKAARLGKTLAAGAIADTTVFTGREGRFSDLLTQHFQNPVLNNTVTRFLASNPDDSWALARFKQGLEGMGLGLATEGVFGAARFLWGLKNARPAEVKSSIEDLVKWTQDSDRAKELVGKVLDATPNISESQAQKTLLFSALQAKATGRSVDDYLSKLIDIRKSVDGLPPPGTLNHSPLSKAAAESVSIANESLQSFKNSSADFTAGVQAKSDARISAMENQDAEAALQRGDVPEPLTTRAGQPATPQPREAGPDALPLDDSLAPYDLANPKPDTAKPDALPLEGGTGPKPFDLKDKPVRGFIQAQGDLGAIIYLHSSADASTFVHEMAHYARLYGGLRPSTLAGLEQAYGVVDGQWTPEAEEKFASAFERYVFDGVSPSPELEPAMSEMSKAMVNVYKTVNHPAIASPVSLPVRKLFNDMLGFGGDSLQAGKTKGVAAPALAQKANIPLEIKRDVAAAVESPDSPDPIADAATALNTHINYTRINLSESGENLLHTLQDKLDQTIFSRRGGVQSNQVTESLANAIAKDHGITVPQAQAFTAKLDSNTRNLAARALAGRILNNSFIEQARQAIALSEATPLNPGLRQQADEALQNVVSSLVLTNNTQSEIARALQAYNISSDFISFSERQASRVVDKMTTAGPMELARLRRAIALAEDPRSAAQALTWFDQAVEKTTGKVLSVLNEWYVNSLLGGLKTHITNLTSQTVQTLLLPATRIAGGIVGLDRQAIQSGFRVYSNLVHTALDTFQWAADGLHFNPDSAVGQAAKAWLKEQPILTSITKIDDPFHAITSQNLGIKNPLIAQGVDWLGKAIRLPTRMLTGADEFFKQLNYRAWLRDEAYQTAFAQGLDKDPQAFAEFVGRYLEDGFDHTGAAKSDTALMKAKQSTFTQDLVDGTLTKTIADAANKHPMLRQVIPFIRVPTNLLKAARDYTPGINLLFKEFRHEFFSPDHLIAADARGRMALGSLFWMMTGGLALSGSITGGGPKDPEQRAALMATGWRPYSFVTTQADGTKAYLEYKRTEPFAALLGIAADFTEIMGHADDQTTGDMAKAMTVALAKNLTNKTYVNSMAEVVNVLSDPEPNVDKFIQNRVGVYAVPGMLQNFKNDDAMRDVQTYMDAVKQRLPGYSNTIPPKRDLFGEKINAPAGFAFDTFRYSTRIGDPVKEELARLEYGFSMPPRKLMGVDLKSITNDQGRQAYDRYTQLQGEVTIGGRTLPQALTETINSPRYKSMPDPEGPQDTFNGKVKMVQSVIGRYREAAARQLLKEFPQIRQMKNAIDQKRRDAVRPASNVLQLLAH